MPKRRYKVVTEEEYKKNVAKSLPVPKKKPKIKTGDRQKRITKAVTAQTRKR
jgi:hypothetical protein